MTFGQEAREVSQTEEQPRQRNGLCKGPEAGATWKKEVSVCGAKTGGESSKQTLFCLQADLHSSPVPGPGPEPPGAVVHPQMERHSDGGEKCSNRTLTCQGFC